MAGDRRPLCVIVTGRPGSGKSTLAPQLATRLRLPLVVRDQLKEGYAATFGRGHEALPSDTNRIVSTIFGDVVTRLLEGGVSVVIEAAFQHQGWAGPVDAIRRIAVPRVVLCTVPAEIAAARRRARAVEDPDHAWFHGESAASGPWVEPDLDVPTLRVDTRDGYRPSLEGIAAFARGDAGPASAPST